jgi:hypothetical protein
MQATARLTLTRSRWSLERFHFSSSVLGAMPTAAVGVFLLENNSMATLRGHGTRYTGDETALDFCEKIHALGRS